jgi:hypothetical protein
MDVSFDQPFLPLFAPAVIAGAIQLLIIHQTCTVTKLCPRSCLVLPTIFGSSYFATYNFGSATRNQKRFRLNHAYGKSNY